MSGLLESRRRTNGEQRRPTDCVGLIHLGATDRAELPPGRISVAPTSTKSSGTRVQTWLPIPLVEQLKAQAELERRSVSSVVRLAVEDQLRRDGRRP